MIFYNYVKLGKKVQKRSWISKVFTVFILFIFHSRCTVALNSRTHAQTHDCIPIHVRTHTEYAVIH